MVREIGYVMTGADHRLVPFAIREGARVEVGDYVLFKHPYKQGDTYVLAHVVLVRPYNPEMRPGRPGPHEASRRGRVRYGSWIEYRIAYAEPLGYYDEGGRWRPLECAPSTWDPVFEPSEEELKDFFRPKNGRNGLLITIGHVSKHKDIPVQIDLSEVAKGHMFICGMTRSGKSTFVVNLAINAMKSKPRPRIIILDRRGEYGVLSYYGALVFDYKAFLPRPKDVEPVLLAEVLADLVGVPANDKTVRDAIARLIGLIRKDMKNGLDMDFTPETLMSYIEQLQGIKESTRGRLKLYLDPDVLDKLVILDPKRKCHDILEVLKTSPIVVVDFSTDSNFVYQHLTVANLIRRVVRHAMEVARRREPFAAIFVIEEAQYIAPERGMKITIGQPEKVGADKALVEGVSQAGGYNVGFIVMTQRPAYVMKSVISQCNTVMCFRLRNPNDQDTVARYTEYGGERLTSFMPGLADFEAILCGMASTIPFPVMVETHVMEYPRKATITAREAWEHMDAEVGVPVKLNSEVDERGEAHERPSQPEEEAEEAALAEVSESSGEEDEGSGTREDTGAEELGAREGEEGQLEESYSRGEDEGPIADLFEPPY